VCSFTAQMAALVALPFEIQRLGRSAVETGLLITPWPIAVALGRWAAASGAAVSAERAVGLALSVEPLLGADGAGHHAVAMRAAALVGANAADREDIAIAMRTALGLARPDAPLTDTEALAVTVGDVARSVLAAALDHGADASQLGAMLDAVLLGSRPRPQSVTNLVRSA